MSFSQFARKIEVCWYSSPCAPLALPQRCDGVGASLLSRADDAVVPGPSAETAQGDGGRGTPLSAATSLTAGWDTRIPLRRRPAERSSTAVCSGRQLGETSFKKRGADDPCPAGNFRPAVRNDANPKDGCLRPSLAGHESCRTCTQKVTPGPPATSWSVELIRLMKATGVLEQPLRNPLSW